MESNSLVSIIVPCYNQAHFLDETLQSVISQSYKTWECIIVNDGSLDNTEEVASNWLSKDNRFKYISKVNGGLSSARNEGIKNSTGLYILPLDSDDVIHYDFLKKLIPKFIENQKIAIVSCYKYHFKKRIDKPHFIDKPKGEKLKDLKYENILMASSLYKRICWDEVGGYDEKMKNGFEDWEFWINITKRGWDFIIVEEPLFYYRKSKTSMLTDTLKNHIEDNLKYIFNKHKEIYIEDFDMTLYYLLFLLKRHRTSEVKLKASVEYKIGKLIMKPYRIVKKYFNNNEDS